MPTPQSPIVQEAGWFVGRKRVNAYTKEGAWSPKNMHNTDFSAITGPKGGCTIHDTALRALDLCQLERIIQHSSERFEEELWLAWPGNSDCDQISTISQVNLYLINDYAIKAATFQRQCSMVELIASEPQPPDIFCSHWW